MARIRASATAVLSFGENDGCRGILLGGKPHMGMKQMFRMMNGARIAVGSRACRRLDRVSERAAMHVSGSRAVGPPAIRRRCGASEH
jgi:alkylation response protein AidB-like acyl-CoA dehydrogenase